MQKLFVDKTETLTFDVQVEGAENKEVKTRLVLESNDLNIFYNGKISRDGKCVVKVKNLKSLLPESSTGTMRLEVIADDMLFETWNDEFVVDKSVKVSLKGDARKNVSESTEQEPIKVRASIVKKDDVSTYVNDVRKICESMKIEPSAKNRRRIVDFINRYAKNSKDSITAEQKKKILTTILN